MTGAEILVYAGTIVAGLCGAIGIVWKQGNDREATLNRLWAERLADKDKENAWLKTLLEQQRVEMAGSTARDDKLAATMKELNDTVTAVLPPPPRR